MEVKILRFDGIKAILNVRPSSKEYLDLTLGRNINDKRTLRGIRREQTLNEDDFIYNFVRNLKGPFEQGNIGILRGNNPFIYAERFNPLVNLANKEDNFYEGYRTGIKIKNSGEHLSLTLELQHDTVYPEYRFLEDILIETDKQDHSMKLVKTNSGTFISPITKLEKVTEIINQIGKILTLDEIEEFVSLRESVKNPEVKGLAKRVLRETYQERINHYAQAFYGSSQTI